MSKLNYLPKSMRSSSRHLKPTKAVEIPENTSRPIIEDESEENEEDGDEEPVAEISPQQLDTEPKTSNDIALEVFNEILDIVFEAETENTEAQIVNNSMLRQNVHKLHKQVFVKVKVGADPLAGPTSRLSGGASSAIPLTQSLDSARSSFKSLKHKSQKAAAPEKKGPVNSRSFRQQVQKKKQKLVAQKAAKPDAAQ